MEPSMSFATEYATVAAASARSAESDYSLLAVTLIAAVGMLASTLATLVNPQWFIG
jgi:hypothetical protein